MRTVLNIIWLFLGGIWLALGYVVAGILACLLVVTAPAGLAAFRMARYVLWPFGSAVVYKTSAGTGSTVMNVLWVVLFGWWLALGHIATAIAQSFTIVGIASAVVNLKMLPLAIAPFGKQIVPASSLPAGSRPLHSI